MLLPYNTHPLGIGSCHCNHAFGVLIKASRANGQGEDGEVALICKEELRVGVHDVGLREAVGAIAAEAACQVRGISGEAEGAPDPVDGLICLARAWRAVDADRRARSRPPKIPGQPSWRLIAQKRRRSPLSQTHG